LVSSTLAKRGEKVQARCLKVKRIARVCLHGTPGRSAAACNEPGRRSGATRMQLWAINVRSIERALLDRWEDDAGEKAWRSTARVTGRALSGRCVAAPCHVCAVAPSKRPSGKTNRVSHSTRLLTSPKNVLGGWWARTSDNLDPVFKKKIWIQNDLVSQSG
jgi:hypothetical protein